MKVLILGSTGGTGQQLVLQSLGHNYEVTALARDPSKLKQPSNADCHQGKCVR